MNVDRDISILLFDNDDVCTYYIIQIKIALFGFFLRAWALFKCKQRNSKWELTVSAQLIFTILSAIAIVDWRIGNASIATSFRGKKARDDFNHCGSLDFFFIFAKIAHKMQKKNICKRLDLYKIIISLVLFLLLQKEMNQKMIYKYLYQQLL